jgi:hypothetical protein
MTPEQLKALTLEQLNQLRQDIEDEQVRREVLRTAEANVNQIIQKYNQAAGRKDGDAWVQPLGGHDSYLKDAKVTHNGKTWISLHSGNAQAPGVSGWREVVAEGSAPPEWRQPTGAHDSYLLGSRVTFQGKVYEQIFDGANAYDPATVPARWKLIP